jgi:lysophospholipase L1-like esterase
VPLRLARQITIAVVILVSSCGQGEQPASPPLPRRIVAIGDSITRATNACCFPGDHPGTSWSVGDAPRDGVRSHLERIAAADPNVDVEAFNDARAGATVADLVGQARAAVRRRADYVTILIGANDVCGSSSPSMTSVPAFRDGFEAVMETLEAGTPNARMFVASIPNVVRLWRLFRDDPAARSVWRAAGICPSVLSMTGTEAERRAVLGRVRRFNEVLARACGAYPRCRFDGGAVFRYAFRPGDVSSLDRFHPSVEGQAALARITWARSWWS